MSLLAATMATQVTDPLIENQLLVEADLTEIVSEVSNENDNVEKVEELEPKQPETTREIVEDYFSDAPVMIEVAYCESRFRQFDEYGNPLRGRVNAADVGVMQINEKYHGATAARLGHNLSSLDGNLAYARYLYETQGTKPWVHSSPCWNAVREVAFAI